MEAAEVTEILRQRGHYKPFVEMFVAGETRRAVTSLWSAKSLFRQPLNELAKTLAADYVGVIEQGKTVSRNFAMGIWSVFKLLRMSLPFTSNRAKLNRDGSQHCWFPKGVFHKESFLLLVPLVRAVSLGFVNLRLDVMRSASVNIGSGRSVARLARLLGVSKTSFCSDST
jgi:hypothetical protein